MNSFVTRFNRRFPFTLGLALLALLASASFGAPPPAAEAAQVHAVLVGNLQTELGAPADWDPANNTTLMKDPNADGIYTLTGFVPAGDWEYKVSLNGTWNESYPERTGRGQRLEPGGHDHPDDR